MTRVIGYGTPDAGDDAAGLLVARRLRKLGFNAKEHCGDGLSLLESLRGRNDLIVVDAVMTGAKAGTIFEWDVRSDLPQLITTRTSTHSFGLAEALELGRALDAFPKRMIVVGIEGRDFTVGATPSPRVLHAVDLVIQKLAYRLTKSKEVLLLPTKHLSRNAQTR